MSPSKRPENLPIYQIETFDSNDLNKDIKQIKGAIDCFKIIHTCLKGYFDGQVYMYKPISAQLRILFCDSFRGKDNSLIYRIHPDIKLLAFKEIKFENQSGPISIASTPYYIVDHKNGVVDATLDIAPPYKYLSLKEWRTQIIDFSNLNVNDIIRSVADKDGGAHLDDTDCEKLKKMRGHNPTKIGSNVLFIISLAHYVIDFANQITPIWIQNENINV